MKNLKFKSAVLLGIASVALLFSACKKNTDYEPVEASGIAFFNASPDAPSLGLYVDNNRVLNKAFNYLDHVAYLAAYPGYRQIAVTPYEQMQVLKSATGDFAPGKAYTVYVIGKLADLNIMRTEDDLKAPAAGKAKIRFIHLSPDAEKLSIKLQGAAASLFPEKAFKESTDFIEVDPGDLIFEIDEQGGKAAHYVLNAKIEKDKIYTIYAGGSTAADATKLFTAGIINNK